MQRLRLILTTLLSVYLLVLMVLPCSDAHSSVVTLDKDHHGHKDNKHQDNDMCTPFCVCSGCTAAIVLHAPMEFMPLLQDNDYPVPVVFYNSISSAFFGSIWQPPQLV